MRRSPVFRFPMSLLFLLLVALSSFGQGYDPAWAVVRLPSHGVSATVISTAPGRTLLLGCAHGFEGADRLKRITVNMPSPVAGPAKNVSVRLVALDYRMDLSIIEVSDGPVPYVCSVAPSGTRVPGKATSVGYDEMKLSRDGRPSVIRAATIVANSSSHIYTYEIPWHGRSGGALIDPTTGRLIGVVQGYEVDGERRGMYISHATILSFLAAGTSTPAPYPSEPYGGRPAVREYVTPGYRLTQPYGPSCPGGVCQPNDCVNGYCPNNRCPNGVCPIR